MHVNVLCLDAWREDYSNQFRSFAYWRIAGLTPVNEILVLEIYVLLMTHLRIYVYIVGCGCGRRGSVCKSVFSPIILKKVSLFQHK